MTGAVVAAAAAGGFWWALQSEPEVSTAAFDGEGAALVENLLPAELSANAQNGETIYQSQCADCHGVNAVGQDGVAPPLVHVIYEPSHHGDEAFQRAVSVGVQQHHWSFGNMPAVEGLTRGDVAMVVDYIRELQQANGIN
ncbi:cytochrome C [Jannaschia sp. EhC01]|nr:cytochrome C [Jannaschia sp. EhC01]